MLNDKKTLIVLANLTWIIVILSYGLMYGGTNAPEVAKHAVFSFCCFLSIIINIPISIYLFLDFAKNKHLNLYHLFHLLLRGFAIKFLFLGWV